MPSREPYSCAVWCEITQSSIPTLAPAAWARSAFMILLTASVLAKRSSLKEFKYSLNDLDSTSRGLSCGKVTSAKATTGLPFGVSHETSTAFQQSEPFRKEARRGGQRCGST